MKIGSSSLATNDEQAEPVATANGSAEPWLISNVRQSMNGKKRHLIVGIFWVLICAVGATYEVIVIADGYKTGSIRSAGRGHHDEIITQSTDGMMFDIDMGAHYLIATTFLVFAVLKINEVANSLRLRNKPNQSSQPTAASGRG